MKKLLATGLVGAAVVIGANGQGTVYFRNYFGTGSDPKVYFNDGTTAARGAQYVIGLWGGATAGSMTLVATTTFWPGAPGYFIDGVVTIPGVPVGGTAYLTVVVWDQTLGGTTTGASEAQAYEYMLAGHGNIWAASGWNPWMGGFHPFTAITGNPYGNPPTDPGLLDGMQSFHFDPIPEPSPYVLGVLGGCTVMLLRQRGKASLRDL